MSATSTKPISIAYSPDTDDAFMVHAMRHGLVDLMGYEFTFLDADIQVLNEAARRGVYDVTAISVAAFPGIQDEYLLMPVGASIGDQFGPAIIVRNDSPVRTPAELQGRTVAVPGRQTSAFFAARGLIGDFIDKPTLFTEIGPAVARGEVDAGILIHELQLDCERLGFRRLGDLGSLWHAAHGLPLPLGANAIRRSLGTKVIKDVVGIMRASIEAGLANRGDTLTNALKSSKAELDLMLGERYISMYVNHRSLSFEADVRKAMERLFAIGQSHGIGVACDLAHAFAEG